MNSAGAPIFDGTKDDRRYKPYKRRLELSTSAEAKDEDSNGKQEFQRIMEEVQKLGSSQLNWKERKVFEAKKLSSLGAKPMKSFKMPISMGLNIKRKREKLEADKLEQDILAGFLPAKSRKRAAFRGTEKGLELSEGKFKGGVLYVQKPVVKGVQAEKRRRDGSLDRNFYEGGTKGPRKSKKGKGMKGGGKKKGGKRKR